MSGKRQHFVPRFLQRGFVSHTSDGEFFTWLRRKNSRPLNTNLKNAGVEGFFYSHDHCTKLDEAITQFEGSACHLISALRDGLPLPSDPSVVPSLLAHLEMRTRHVRQSFLEAGNYLIDELMKFVSNEEAFGKYFRRAMQQDPSIMREALVKEMYKHGISTEYLPSFTKLSEQLLETMLPMLTSQMSEFAEEFRRSAPAKLKDSAKLGQIKAMQRSLAPMSKVERFASLTFDVVALDGAPIVLGDSIVIFQVESERGFRPFLDEADELVAVYLPLSPHRVLVGSKASITLDSARLRREIARCSLEYFVASEAPPQHDDLVSLIGENAHLLSVDQINEIMNDVLSK